MWMWFGLKNIHYSEGLNHVAMSVEVLRFNLKKINM